MKASLNMSNQEFGHVPVFMERTARLLALGSSRKFSVRINNFLAYSTFPIKSLKKMIGGRVHSKQGLVTVFLFASHKHRKFWKYCENQSDLVYFFWKFLWLKRGTLYLMGLRILISYLWWYIYLMRFMWMYWAREN